MINTPFTEITGDEITPALPTISAPGALAQTLTARTGWDGDPASPLLKSWASLTKLRQSHRILPTTPADAAELAKRHATIAAAVDAMENPPMLKDHVRAVPDIERYAVAIKSRGGQIAALEAGFAAGAFDESKPLKLRPGINPYISDAFTADDEPGKFARGHAASVRKLIAEYWLDYLKAHSRLSPEDRISEIHLEMSRTNLGLDELKALNAELRELEGSGTRMIAENANAEFVVKTQALREQVRLLDMVLLDGVRLQQRRVIAEEIAFFKTYNLIPEPTAASKQYNATIQSLEASINRKPENHARSYPASPEILAAGFVLEILPGLV